MDRSLGRYAEYVEHSRFGRQPRFTGLDVDGNFPGVHLHWINGIGSYDDGTRLIAGTAIKADLARQTPATFPVTHYYDLDKLCRDCGRRFIFFAEEQKHWYEELEFPLDANCIRCPTCRKKLQLIAKKRRRYEALFHISNRGDEENLDMADCCLTLIEEGIFGQQQLERVRMLLKQISVNRRLEAKINSVTKRLQAAETKKREQNAAPTGTPRSRARR
jgi:Probable zinc-ribbon domain